MVFCRCRDSGHVLTAFEPGFMSSPFLALSIRTSETAIKEGGLAPGGSEGNKGRHAFYRTKSSRLTNMSSLTTTRSTLCTWRARRRRTSSSTKPLAAVLSSATPLQGVKGQDRNLRQDSQRSSTQIVEQIASDSTVENDNLYCKGYERDTLQEETPCVIPQQGPHTEWLLSPNKRPVNFQQERKTLKRTKKSQR